MVRSLDQTRPHLVNTQGRGLPVPDRAGHDLFRVAKTVKRGRVNPMDAVIESGVNRRDRVRFVLRTHAAIPATAPNCPGANPYGGDLQVAGSKLALLDGWPPIGLSLRPRNRLPF